MDARIDTPPHHQPAHDQLSPAAAARGEGPRASLLGRGIAATMRAGARMLWWLVPRLPLGARKRAAILVNRLPGTLKELMILWLLDDWGEADPEAYHRFIWSHHLLFAKYYDFRGIEHSRGFYFDRLHPLRLELLETVAGRLREQGASPEADVRSVLDVGCSLGYLLRHAETSVFPGAKRLVGVDIDAQAIAEGARYLQGVGSSVELRVTDLATLDSLVGRETFDVVTCTGVLQYLQERNASHAVGTMLKLTSRLLALGGPACEEVDNAELEGSRMRGSYDDDLSLIHNFDRMITENGGRVVARRWGSEIEEDRRPYFVIGAPGTTE